MIALIPGEPSLEARAAVQRVCEVLELIAGALDKRKARNTRNPSNA